MYIYYRSLSLQYQKTDTPSHEITFYSTAYTLQHSSLKLTYNKVTTRQPLPETMNRRLPLYPTKGSTNSKFYLLSCAVPHPHFNTFLILYSWMSLKISSQYIWMTFSSSYLMMQLTNLIFGAPSVHLINSVCTSSLQNIKNNVLGSVKQNAWAI